MLPSLFKKYLLQTPLTPNPSNVAEFQEQLAKLRNSHIYFSHMMKLETWAMIDTMDDYFPGFWNRYMINRQSVFREFLQQQNQQKNSESK